jgi:hypothetical protein
MISADLLPKTFCTWLFSLALIVSTNNEILAGDEATPLPANSVAVPMPGPKTIGASDDSKTLVGQLGHDLFAVREGATNKLIEKGVASKPILVAALTSNDAEVRFRAKRILSIIVDADFQKRKKAFIADTDGTANATLPGWSVFKEAIGSDQLARDLFVEMQDAETQLLEAYEQGPERAAAMLKERSQVAIDRVQPQGRRNQRPGNMNLPVIAALMFVGGDPAVPLADDVATRIASLPLNPTFMNLMSTGGPRRDLFRKLFGRWVARDMSSDLITNNLAYAGQYNLKEALEPALKTLKSHDETGTANKGARTLAMILLGRFGSKEYLADIQPYLSDTHLVFDSGGENQPTQAQMRDLALAVTIKLSGQDPKQFGFENLLLERFNSNMVAFRNDSDRNAAFKKWEDWQKKQRQAASAKAAAKSDG